MIETPLAILNLREIAAAAREPSTRLACFVMGTNDLVKDTRAELDGGRTAAMYWLSAAVTAARAYGIEVLDGVYNAFKDAEGFRRECLQGRQLGMDGKTLIHPDQIAAANEIFSPADDEVAWSRKIIAAFAEPENRGKGVITVDGRMVELLHAEIGTAYGRYRRGNCGARSLTALEKELMPASKTTSGNHFEDFRLGQEIVHATPRTLTEGDVAVYASLYGARFAVQSSDMFARTIGYPRAPIDDLLVFHTVFGKTVPDISLNAVANLGYADCRFLAPVYPGDTLSAVSEVIGLRENSNRETGVVYVRSTGLNQDGAKVLEYVRWVMVRKRDKSAPAPEQHVPDLPDRVAPDALGHDTPGTRTGRLRHGPRRVAVSLVGLRGR